ncbi:MAG: intein-containing replicative DNA helicase, partial [Gammaproteobacteria bacterium]|nr:intein-containing replicative DNA helicase [Gammaproteobacteria bacterium]
GRIDQQAVRSGQLSKEDWPRIGSTINLIADAPVFIDDTPALTPGELRSRARRVAREQKGLQLIVVDYLQLMRVSDDPENRTAEISEISRSLKALAKELHVPVIALSQLNRSLEQRADKRPMMSDLRECVTGETLVNLADGRRIPIAQLVGQEVDVIAIDEHKKLLTARCNKIWAVGNKPVYKISFASGKVLRATKEHRIMTFKGWTTVSDLKIKDRIATARVLPEPIVKNVWSEHQLILLAHMIGDGSYLKHQSLRYTTCSEENSLAVKKAAELGFGVTVKKYESDRSWHQLVLGGNGTRWQPAGINKWLRELNIFNQRSHEKHIPEELFTLSNQQISLFLKHLWATDGCIFVKKENDRGADVIHYSTNSLLLARDVTSLLLRFGIVARIKKTQKGNYRPGYLVVITGTEQQKKFISEIGAFGPRIVQAEALLKKMAARKSNTNVDTVPIEVFEEVKMVMNARGISQRKMASLRGTSYGGTSHFKFEPSRTVLLNYADLLDNDSLKCHANSDIFWDRVVGIEADDEEEVYDLTVPGPACWLADSIVSHNSGAIEQDADLIMFIYRDEVYHPNTSDAKNIAEIILAKHRNGPIGKIKLNFCGPYVRFDNLAQRYRAESIE